jgi:hypothetical protein
MFNWKKKLLLTTQNKRRVAADWNTNTQTLDILASDKNADVRYDVATNINTSASVLEVLAKDNDWGVRKAVAENPNTKLITLDCLTNDMQWQVRSSAASNPCSRTSKKLAVAQKTSTSIPVLEYMVEYEEEIISAAAKETLKRRI